MIFLDCTRKENHLKCFIILYNSISSTPLSFNSRCSLVFFHRLVSPLIRNHNFSLLSVHVPGAHKKSTWGTKTKEAKRTSSEWIFFYLHYGEIMTRAAKKLWCLACCIALLMDHVASSKKAKKESTQMLLARNHVFYGKNISFSWKFLAFKCFEGFSSSDI